MEETKSKFHTYSKNLYIVYCHAVLNSLLSCGVVEKLTLE